MTIFRFQMGSGTARWYRARPGKVHVDPGRRLRTERREKRNPNHVCLAAEKTRENERENPPPEMISPEKIATPTPEPSVIAKIVLDSDPETLAKTLYEPGLRWTPSLVDQTLKTLWNHGPKAVQFFKTLEKHPSYIHSPSSFDHAIDVAARLRDYRTVWTLVHRMKSLRIGPSPKTFAIVAERYVTAGMPDRAVKVFMSMHEHGCAQSLRSFNSVLDVLCKSNHVEKAYNLLRAFRRKFDVDLISYNTIVNGWCLVKRTPRALEVLEEMVDRGFTPNLISYNIMLKGFLRTSQVDEAWGFFLEMKRRLGPEIDVVTYTTLVHGLGVLGEVKRARKIFDGMVGDGVLPSVVTYNAMIQVLCKKDTAENAAVVFEEMARKGYAPNLTTYTVLIRGLCHAGTVERAVELVGRMRADGLEPNVQVYNVLIRYLVEAGEIEKGLGFFEEMEMEGTGTGTGICLPNFDTYNILISGMFTRRRSEDLVVAGKLLIEMVDRGFVPRRLIFSRVLDGLLLTGNQDFAKEILRLQSKCGRLPRRFRL